MPYYSKPRKPKRGLTQRKDDDPFRDIRISIPSNMYADLEKRAAEKKLPVGRLINIAVYNELELEEPFNFDLTLPVDEYRSGLYEDEAIKLHNFLAKIPSGVGLDTLMLMREAIGLTHKELLLAYMQLKENGRIEEYYPARAAFQYAEDYRYIRCKDVHHSTMMGQRFKSVEGKSVRYKVGAESPIGKLSESLLKKKG